MDIQQQSFNYAWRSVPASAKLVFYEKKKLKILAKRKNIRGYYKMETDELIKVLRPVVVDSDFPIKD
jgi:fructose-1,6-bisphosphatase